MVFDNFGGVIIKTVEAIWVPSTVFIIVKDLFGWQIAYQEYFGGEVV